MANVALRPTGDQVRHFRDRATGNPISMLNLLKFKPKAEYEDGRETDLTGEQAYQLYSEAFLELMVPRGCRVIYSGNARGLLIGELSTTDHWDAVAVIEYPSTQVMLDMWREEAYERASEHRTAGLEGQLLLECGPGSLFGA